MKFSLIQTEAEIDLLRQALKMFMSVEMRITEIEQISKDQFRVNIFYRPEYAASIFVLGKAVGNLQFSETA